MRTWYSPPVDKQKDCSPAPCGAGSLIPASQPRIAPSKLSLFAGPAPCSGPLSPVMQQAGGLKFGVKLRKTVKYPDRAAN